MAISPTTTALITLAGTLGGVGLTGLIGAWRTMGDHRHERRMKELDVRIATESGRRAERRESYEEFLTATDNAYQLAADLYARTRRGEQLEFRVETREVVAELMRRELALALLATASVRRNAREYVSSLRDLLVESAQGCWSDTTKQSRNQLFVSMIADINPGNEPGTTDVVEKHHPEIPPPTVSAP